MASCRASIRGIIIHLVMLQKFYLPQNSASDNSVNKANTIERKEACLSNFVQKLIYSRILADCVCSVKKLLF